MSYCGSRFRTIRRVTREVKVGSVGVGGSNPIRLQSMTTSDTQDVAATVKQAIALAEVGCEIVRVTAPNATAARCLREIRAQFTAAGFSAVPLVADIHFLPVAAMEAVEHVEKIRVNPGNYADRKKFAVREYSDAEYDRELTRLHDAFSPLVLRCKALGRAMRIGTNHGSLSDRIMNRYGDTPLGMVESALEFIRIAESHGFRDIILSMKASNPKVMIQAYRLLVQRMDAENMPYPLHLGVTEAGDGEDGRIKSAIGIGSLLLDGLGDTIRVSLTEDSVYEIPVARALADKAEKSRGSRVESRKPEPPADSSVSDSRLSALDSGLSADKAEKRAESSSAVAGAAGPGRMQPPPDLASPRPATASNSDSIDPFHFSRRNVLPLDLGANARIDIEQPPRVVVNAGALPENPGELVAAVRAARPKLKDTPLEGLLVAVNSAADLARAIAIAPQLAGEIEALFVEMPSTVALPADLRFPAAPRIALVRSFDAANAAFAAAEFVRDVNARGGLPVLALSPASASVVAGLGEAGSSAGGVRPGSTTPATVDGRFASFLVTLATPANGFAAPEHAVGAWRQLVEQLRAGGIAAPLWIRNTASTAIAHEPAFLSRLLEASVLTGALLTDGIGDVVSIETESDLVRATRLAYNVLQGAGARISKTEFVACPSCGRTLFDLQTTTQRIRAQTGHLKGVKIAIMGCIVNGPGEMADADFGYVGGAPGRINLYVGKNCVEYNIPAADADQRLIGLIKQHGKWLDPEPSPESATAAEPAGTGAR